MKAKFFLVIAGSFLVFSVNAQIFSDEKGFEDWDSNKDGKISKEEYSLNSKMLDRWDDNGDDRISRNEFQNSYFALFDSDSDGNIESEEISNLYFLLPSDKSMAKKDEGKSEDMRYGAGSETLSQWDTDGDKSVSKDEFNSRADKVFTSWDKNGDGYISNTELYNNTFSWWDQDSNGNIEKSEFEEMKNVKKDRSFWEKIF